jgi:hypothetical protein
MYTPSEVLGNRKLSKNRTCNFLEISDNSMMENPTGILRKEI